jgi:hypothetical protein
MRWRSARWIAAVVSAGLLAPVAVGVAGIAGARGEVYTPRGPGAPSAPVDRVAVPTHDPGKPTVVILLGPEGANAADVLAPYEVFAATGAAAIGEMAVAMYAPFMVLFPPLWLGVLSVNGLMVLGHVLMLFTIGAVMLRRRDEYT